MKVKHCLKFWGRNFDTIWLNTRYLWYNTHMLISLPGIAKSQIVQYFFLPCLILADSYLYKLFAITVWIHIKISIVLRITFLWSTLTSYKMWVLNDLTPRANVIKLKSLTWLSKVSKIDCLRIVMCPLLVPAFQGWASSFLFFFLLLWPLTVLMKQTRCP